MEEQTQHEAAAEPGEDIPAAQTQDVAAPAPAPEFGQQSKASSSKKKGKAVAHDLSPRKMSLRSALNWKWKA
ncbi:hypothetical protein L484_022413 [Morus notabilis]|uniref:Uncharacterized protein n=1 Tax=Morus notabilis TaxID=981085 RepID=W9RFC0_9ROSA|nr:hypothetical protein L484_022413 [Morus notabilis]